MTDFSSFGLSGRVLSALAKAGYSAPTPIQQQAIPLALAGRDIVGLAQTGTGKTAAFAAPILDRLARTPSPAPARGARALVLAPTRELAAQIADSFETYSAGLSLRIAMVCGGKKIGGQIRQLERGAHILVATPGRLIDLMEQRAVTLKDVEVLVLDEADQMLDLGFIHALKTIARYLPAKRQTLFFSATMPKMVAELAAQYLNNPARVSVAPPATTAEKIEQRICFVEQAEKQALLAETIRQPEVRTALVFVRTKHGADAVVRRLAKDNIDAVAIHGNKSQAQRERALDAFREGRVPVLIATDIAARGIHVDALTHVINFDLPDVAEQYVHRIGRTARAGASGVAISFVSRAERPLLRDIEKLTGLKLAPRGTAEEEAGNPDARRRQGQRQGQGQGQRRSQQPSGKQHRKGPPAPRSGDAPSSRAAGGQSSSQSAGQQRSGNPGRNQSNSNGGNNAGRRRRFRARADA